MIRPALILPLVLAAWLGQPDSDSPLRDPRLQQALAEAETRLGDYVEEWIRIAEIPAPSGGEENRGAHLELLFRNRGLERVARDDAGNVTGFLPGRDPALKQLAILAHLDTVASAGTDHTVRRQPGEKLVGPGIRDDSSGLAGMVAVLDLIKRNRLVPPAGTWFVATVREEIGLLGAEAFVGEHASRLGGVIAVDGHLGQISHAATGIVWLELHFTTSGGHTLRSSEQPSAILAAARAIERINAIPVRRSPESMQTWLNIGSIGGGDVPNAVARDVWFTVDLRSNDPQTLRQLKERIEETGRATARQIGVGFEPRTLHAMEGGRIPGSGDSPLVRAAREALEILGWNQVEVTLRGTADHNVAIQRGIPAIAIGVTTGGNAHAPGEWADIPPFATGIRQLLILVCSPVTAEQGADS